MSGIFLSVGETMAVVAPTTAIAVDGAQDFRVDAGGAESNVAAHVAALGLPARWVSALGDDPLGHRIAAQLAARGIDVSAVTFSPTHRTGLYVKNPGRGVHYYRDGSAAAHLSIADADAIDLAGVALLHVSGITAALDGTAPAFLDRLLTRAAEAGVPVSLDVNYRAALWPVEVAAPPLLALARRADIVFVGRDEAEPLWQTASASEVRALLPEVELIVKDGEVGATVFTGSEEVFVPSRRVEVVEAVGAGDAFAGGYLAERLRGAAPAARLAAGHARAALTLTTTSDSVDDVRPDTSAALTESEST